MEKQKTNLNLKVNCWKRIYYEEEEYNKAKCLICGKIVLLRTYKQNAKNHLNNDHPKSEYQSFPSTYLSTDWQSQFETQSNEMICKLCSAICPIQTCTSGNMASHLKIEHEIDDKQVEEIITQKYVKLYNKDKQRNTYICKNCRRSSPDSYNITLLKHLIDCHSTDLPAKMKPSELRSPLNYDGEADIATSNNYQYPNQFYKSSTSLNYGGQAGINTTNYQQPIQFGKLSSTLTVDDVVETFASIDYQQPNQFHESNTSLNYSGEAGINTTINYQQPFQFYESSMSLNYGGEAGINTTNYQQPIQFGKLSSTLTVDDVVETFASIDYQQPNQFHESNTSLNYSGEAGINTINYQQPIQLGEASSTLNYDEEAGNATSTNNQQPNVYSSDSDRSNKLPTFINTFKKR